VKKQPNDMKFSILCSLLAFGVASSAMAGSFGGPPPFTNLSPLQSGIDGSYQATARGKNITGIIRFAYQNGVQSPIASANSYVFFVNGVVTSGSTTASITGKELAGVLGGVNFEVPTNEEGTVELPAVFVVRGNRASGQFTGQIDLNDRMSYFSGNGEIIGAGDENVTFITISEESEGVENDGTNFSVSPISSTNLTIPGSEGLLSPGTTTPALVPGVRFKFQGVRTSFTAQGSFSDTPTQSTNQSTAR
jgi:hypothetical protein